MVEMFHSMNKKEKKKKKQIIRLSRRIESIIEKDLIKSFWTEERKSILNDIDTNDLKSVSPYEIVEKIKGSL